MSGLRYFSLGASGRLVSLEVSWEPPNVLGDDGTVIEGGSGEA